MPPRAATAISRSPLVSRPRRCPTLWRSIFAPRRRRANGSRQGSMTAISKVLAHGEQALLFLNRRGYAPLTLCRACGHRFNCPNCTAWLVEHRFRRALMCHHCGHIERRPTICPACEAVDSLAACGPGIERLAEEAATLFPQAQDSRSLLGFSRRHGASARGNRGDLARRMRYRHRHAACREGA